jgi:hypothetical protein
MDNVGRGAGSPMKGDFDGGLGCRGEGDANDTNVSLLSNMIWYADNNSYDVVAQLSVSAQEKRSQRDRKEQEEHVLQEFEKLTCSSKADAEVMACW